MDDYIKREDAIRELNAEGYTKNMRIHKRILDIPAADVRENVRGEWIVDEKEDPNGVDWCHCSVCGCTDITQNISSINYCPNCGADMRGEEDV